MRHWLSGTGTRMSPLTSTEQRRQRRPEQLCDDHRTKMTSVLRTAGFVISERSSTGHCLRDRSLAYLCRPGRCKDKPQMGTGRTEGGRSVTMSYYWQRRGGSGSTGALARMMSMSLRLLLVVGVLSCQTHAEPVPHHHGRQHLHRDANTARHRRPPPFSVDTYDEAVVSHVLHDSPIALEIDVSRTNTQSFTVASNT